MICALAGTIFGLTIILRYSRILYLRMICWAVVIMPFTSSICGLKPRDLYPEADNVYKGAVIENYVMQEFVSYGKPLCYFKPSGSMEMDLMIDREDGICPVEIKSGRNKRSTSLNNYIEKYSPPEAFRLSEKNFGWSETITSLPLYASFCLCQ